MNMKICFLLLIFLSALSGQSEPFHHSQNIFPLQEKHVHGSSLVQIPNGDLLCAWFHGSGERTADDVVINGARLKNGQEQWSEIFLMAILQTCRTAIRLSFSTLGKSSGSSGLRFVPTGGNTPCSVTKPARNMTLMALPAGTGRT